MFKKLETLPISKLFLLSLLLLALPLAACSTLTDTAAAAPTAPTLAAAAAETTGAVPDETAPLAAEPPAAPAVEIAAGIDNTAAAATTADLNDDEIADLLFMREEEKMARDLYLAFYELWGTPVYQNIAASEQAHMDAILLVINQFGLQDPAAGNEPGVFNDPTLQDLYNQLLAAGTLSHIDALLTGAAVEEIDILDLQGSLAQTNNEAIAPVYLNLLAGSENHLRAFVSSWERQTGAIYQPQYLNQDEYADIMSSTPGGSGQGQGGNGQGGSGGGQGQGGQGGQGNQGQGGKGSRGQGGQGNGWDGGIDNGPGGPGGRGQQSTTTN